MIEAGEGKGERLSVVERMDTCAEWGWGWGQGLNDSNHNVKVSDVRATQGIGIHGCQGERRREQKDKLVGLLGEVRERHDDNDRCC